jgi:hypothetical protein
MVSCRRAQAECFDACPSSSHFVPDEEGEKRKHAEAQGGNGKNEVEREARRMKEDDGQREGRREDENVSRFSHPF